MTDHARRGFLARLAAGGAAFAAAAGFTHSEAQAQSTTQVHDLDKWIDDLKGRHKSILDCTTKLHIGDMQFARNFLTAGVSDYGLKDEDHSIIISMRHEATPFGYNDAMWKKYKIGESIDVAQPRSGGRGGRGGGGGGGAGGDARGGAGADSTRTAADSTPIPRATKNPQTQFMTQMAPRGVQFTVCGLATGRYANEFARTFNLQAADVRADLTANLVPNCRVVSAGVIVVNRAQERGFTLLYVG